ncbi:MAG: EamA family transporter [Patescibacteria group bacterium]|nr:EamA family transporter [Patescibacteria group bacterium]
MFPFISALAQVGGILVDKITLTRRQVSVHVFVPILFLFLFLLTALLFPFLGKISIEVFSLRYLLIFLAMIIAATVWNIFYYQGVQSEKVHEFELIMMFQPLLTILLATIFLKGEQNLQIEIVAIIAAIFLIVAHLNKAHLEITLGGYKLLLAVLFMSVELILIKILLVVFSPVALYCIRTGILFIFFFLFYHPQIKKVAGKNSALILASASLGTLQMISKFYGFEQFGVVYTSLVLILSPILVYICSTIFLHEKLKLRTVISAIVILGCIVYASLVGK